MSETVIEISDLKGVLVAFGFQISICAALLVTFSVVRPWLKAVYQPRLLFNTDESKKPPLLSIKPLAWLWPAFYTCEMDMIDQIGMDAIMFLRFISICFRFFAVALVVAIPLLIFNFNAAQIDGKSGVTDYSFKQVFASSLRFLTMENLEADSRYYYVYSFATLFLSILAYVLFYWTWLDYATLRKQYVSTLDYLDSPHCKTLLLNGISSKMKNRNEIERLILGIYPSAEIDQIVYGRNFRDLALLCNEHRKVNDKLEKVLDKYYSGSARPTHNSKGIVGILTFSGEKVDSIRAYSTNLKDLEEKIYELRSKGDEAFRLRNNAFVSFSNLKSVHKILNNAFLPATFIKYGQVIPSVKIRECPPFDDLIWSNLGLSPRAMLFRRAITWTLTALLTLGWTAVIAFINGLSDLRKIAEFSPNIAASIAKSPGAVLILESIVAPGLIIIAIQLLLVFLYYTSLFQGITSWNGISKSIMRKFYFFQIYQFFLFITFSTTWEYLRHPLLLRDIRRSVVIGFVSNSTFYINYTILNYGIYSLEILQAYRLFITWLDYKVFKLVPRHMNDLCKPPEFFPSSITCSLLVIFLFCISYSVVAPLIVPFAALFFGLAYIIFKYQKLYVYETRHESGGSWWPKIFNLLCFSVAFFQLMTGGSIYIISASKSQIGNGRVQSIIVFSQILVTACYWFVMNAIFRHDISSIETKLQPGASSKLDYLISDPAMGDPLPKVWVKEEFKDKLPLEHQPTYPSAVDYMLEKGINNESHIETLNQRSSVFGHRNKSDTLTHISGQIAPPEVILALQ